MTHQKQENINYMLRMSEVITLISKIQDQLFKIITDTEKKTVSFSHLPPMFQQWQSSQKALIDMTQAWLAKPEQALDDQMRLLNNYITIWQDAFFKTQTMSQNSPSSTQKTDRRFQDPTWEKNLFFKALRDSYLTTQQWANDCLSRLELHEKTKNKAQFALRQFMDSLSPSNIWYLNPTVLEETVHSGGENFIKGLQNLLQDLQKNKPLISMVDGNSFCVGKNIATTSGSIVFQNNLLQLIQYNATTTNVHERPVLIISPWINKYYILDMRAENSYVKWLTDQGYTVYITSWKNPDIDMRETDFEDYLEHGLLASIQHIRNSTKTDKVNCVGYCIGGTLLSMGLSYTKKKKMDWIGACTFLVTLLDFSHAGELGLFIDDEQLHAIEEHMNKTGMMEAAQMHTTFNLLRANDLIWSFVINNYLLGKEPFPFDLLYWNSDSTNLPAKMHSTYLRQMYLENNLIKPNTLTMLGETIDLSVIDHSCYFLSTIDDHITPWQASYASAQNLTNAKITFVLANSGHIAGVINPPSKNKGYYTTSPSLKGSYQEWQSRATRTDGSWWTHWEIWLRQYAGKKIPARKITKKEEIEPAPGSYVQKRAL